MALAAVGGAHLSALFQVAFDRLASNVVVDYFRREKLDVKLLKNLKTHMLAINQLIDDAEDKEITNLAVKEWLDELKDVVFDTEDVLDVIATQAHENEVASTTPWNPFDRSLHQELIHVFDRMHCLLEQKDLFGLKPSTRSSPRLETSMRHPTTSIVDQSSVYGRDVDKQCIKKLLLSKDGSNGDVIAIVGMGGLGKTTLAQFVFNDYEINRGFKLKVWVCVSEDFDVIKITKTILEKLTSQSYATNDFDELQMKLRETLVGRMYLVVLDDVWNENYMNWDTLRRPLECGAPGSKILVTTRSEKVASVMRASSPYKLNPLSYEYCWRLFAKHAFENVDSGAHSTFEVLSRELVKKCQGLPLAVKVLGGLVGTKLGYEEWSEVLKSDIWDLSNETSANILPVLRLSYHYLPSNLKRCFAYCSIVPKDFDFRREKLVLLWMGENLLQDSKSKKRIDVGYEYLRDLESRSLIQPASSCGELYFSMHDLVNDLAKSVSGEFYKSFDIGNSFNVSEKTRYISYVRRQYGEDLTRFEGVSEAKRLRTFLPLSQEWLPLPPLLRSEIWPQLNVLRSLTLARAGFRKLPDSIGNLKLLRYLDFSHNDELNQLPESLASLYNLEVLILAYCTSLIKLPSKTRQLAKLNHLDIRYTRSLKEMPLQMGRLKDLDVLTDFVVGKGSGPSIRELKEFKYLRGELSIRGLQNITHPEDALVANLKEKIYLEELRLDWDSYSDNLEDAIIVFENLRPHVNLKKLYIYRYIGTKLPDWSGHYDSFVNLVDIVLWGFKHCFDFSPLGQLPSLKSLSIKWCDSLVTLVELPNEIHQHVGHFSALTYLKISDCPKLELPQHHCFTSVEDLIVRSSCASLRLFPLSLFPKLKELNLEDLQSIESLAVIDEANNINLEYMESIAMENCPNLYYFNEANILNLEYMSLFPKVKGLRLTESSLEVIDEANNLNLEYLEAIRITCCPNFEYFDVGKWRAPKMTYLSLLRNCESLKVLPENMCYIFPSLEALHLYQCNNIEALPQSGLPCNLRTLQISGCNKLVANRSSWGLQRMLSLSTLKIREFECVDLEYFPEEGLLPSSLSTLKIEDVPNLTNLNGKSFQLLTCLETLELRNCHNLQCLPELPTSLSTLMIQKCPLLKSRCQREQGEDWSKIAHIPNIQIIHCESESESDYEYDSSSF